MIFLAALVAIQNIAIQGALQGTISEMNGGSFWGGFARGAAFSVASSALTTGIGNVIGPLGGFGKELLRAGAHGLVGGGLNALQGGNFWQGFGVGSISSLAGSGMQKLGVGQGYLPFAMGAVGAGTSWAMGGDPMSGFMRGYQIGTLNHEHALEHFHYDDGDNPNTAVYCMPTVWGKRLQNFYLLYNGTKLYVVDSKTSAIVYSTDATSGKGEHMNKSASQHLANLGPIPEGEYSYENSNWKSQSKTRQRYNIVRGNGDWGDYNVPLRVVQNNSTRNNFYLHGGFFKGSAGCIDAGANIGKIYQLTQSQITTRVYVHYYPNICF